MFELFMALFALTAKAGRENQKTTKRFFHSADGAKAHFDYLRANGGCVWKAWVHAFLWTPPVVLFSIWLMIRVSSMLPEPTIQMGQAYYAFYWIVWCCGIAVFGCWAMLRSLEWTDPNLAIVNPRMFEIKQDYKRKVAAKKAARRERKRLEKDGHAVPAPTR